MRCPCRKKSEPHTYAACCEPFHAGARVAPTAETLMRSRYSAYARENAAYLLDTWHASMRPTALQFTPGLEWVLLRVIAATTDGDIATVTFVARARTGGRIEDLHEVSRFVREAGRWFYLDGAVG